MDSELRSDRPPSPWPMDTMIDVAAGERPPLPTPMNSCIDHENRPLSPRPMDSSIDTEADRQEIEAALVQMDRDFRQQRPPSPRPPEPPWTSRPPTPKVSTRTNEDDEETKAAMKQIANEAEDGQKPDEELDHQPQTMSSEEGKTTWPQRQTSDGSATSKVSKTSLDTDEKKALRREENRKAFCVNFSVVLLIFGGIAWLIVERVRFEAPVCLSEEVALRQPSICEACGSGTFLIPIGGEFETSWHPGLRAVLYILGLAWCFLGVTIVCDLFMVSIEQITSSTKVSWMETGGGCQETVSTPFWNGSIANLSLIALGSSAPEIILNIVELLQPSRFCLAGELGISTIVGSAAFNLLAITSVCISAIEDQDIRKIEQTDVFFVTATSSICAYIWMWFVLSVSSPDKVEVWEAVLTLLFFPLLIILTYMADKQWLPISPTQCVTGDKTTTFRRVAIHSLSARHQIIHSFTRAGSGSSSFSLTSSGSDLSLTSHCRVPTLGMARRKMIVSETRSEVVLPVELNVALDHPVAIAYCTFDDSAIDGERYEHAAGVLRFEPGETHKEITIKLLHEVKCQSRMETFTVELKPREQHRRTTTRMSMAARASCKNRNSSASVLHSEDVAGSGSHKPPRLGITRTQVMILKDTEPGFLSFEPPKVVACPGAQEVTVSVSRTNGTAGAIKCSYRTVDDGAVAGADFVPVEGDIDFGEGINNANIKIPILDSGLRTRHSRFYVVLEEAGEGVRMSKGRQSARISDLSDMKIVTTKSDEKMLSKGLSKTLGSTTRFGASSALQLSDDACSCAIVLMANAPMLQQYCDEVTSIEWWYWWYMYLICWREQIREAFYCGGTVMEQQYAEYSDWIFHALSLMWKVLFALIPPPVTPTISWFTFVACLIMIGISTIIVKDLAELLGCCAGIALFGEPIPADITAITLVALGTSLPDTLASKIAAEEDESADAAIGNVTGSNSVNVFLGLGLPWTIASIYWKVTGKNDQWRSHSFRGRTLEGSWGAQYPSGGFIMPADSLTYNVSIFSVTAIICLCLLAFRRWRYGGELGGPKRAQHRDSLFLMILWLVYIVGSSFMSASIS